MLVDALVPIDELPTVVLPVVMLLAVMLLVHGVEPVVPRIGIIVVAPRSTGWVVRLGDVTAIIGLTPTLLISVESSGMLPPPSAEPTAPPGVKSGEAMPPNDIVVGIPALQALDSMPPPSKDEPAEPGTGIV